MSGWREDPGAVAWLLEAGVWVRGADYAANMARCADYRARMTRLGALPGKEWAHAIIDDYKAGKSVLDYGLKLAMAALDMDTPPERAESPRRAAGRGADVSTGQQGAKTAPRAGNGRETASGSASHPRAAPSAPVVVERMGVAAGDIEVGF